MLPKLKKINAKACKNVLQCVNNIESLLQLIGENLLHRSIRLRGLTVILSNETYQNVYFVVYGVYFDQLWGAAQK